MNTYELFTVLLVNLWLVGAAIVGVVLLLFSAIFALIRASRNAQELAKEFDSGIQSPLSLFETPPPQPPSAEEPVTPTIAAPMPAIQMPVVVLPEPTPLTPVAIIPAMETLPNTEALSTQALNSDLFPSPSPIEEEPFHTEENSIEPHAPYTPDTLLAKEIAQQIAERRAKLSSPEPYTAQVDPNAETKPDLPVTPTTIPLQSAQSRPTKSGFLEQLPPATRKLQPPTASVVAAANLAHLSVSTTPIHPVVAQATTGLPSTERIPQVRAAEIATVPIPAVPTPVGVFASPVALSVPRSDFKAPSFLALETEAGPTDIQEERRGAIFLIGIVAVVSSILICTFVPRVRNHLPGPIANALLNVSVKLGVETLPPPPPPAKQVEVREYEIIYKPTAVKEVRTAVLGGIVKNISPEPLKNLRVEMQLLKRGGIEQTPPEIRLIPLETPILAPGAEGRFILEIPDKDYWSAKFNRILFEDGKEVVQTYNPVKVTPPQPEPTPDKEKDKNRKGEKKK